jgi:cellulose synthase/poly-beta-1,6-N-acetylglucosamine synthase-like glycosyltransferase
MRVTLAALSFMSAIFAPVWVLFILAGITSVRYRAWEIILIGVLMDFVYLPVGGFFGFPFVATTVSLILVWGLEPLRNQLVFK